MHPIFHDLDEENRNLYGCLAIQHGLGYAGFNRLIGAFGTPSAVYAATPESRQAAYPRLTGNCAASLSRGPNLEAWNRVLERCRILGTKTVIPRQPGYPTPLLSLAFPPPLLFIQGDWKETDALATAMVGTRIPSEYGRKAAFTLARDLARVGITVVSGLAVGIDAEAHAGAIEGKGRTLAVIGCGHGVDYPQANRALRKRIAECGAVLSEFPPGEEPKPNHFPRRNRILSGLAMTTVVVEAGERSGALLTAAHAQAQNRTLFAVPGSIFSPVSLGTHALLRRGAILAATAADIIAKMNAAPSDKTAAAPSDPLLALWDGTNVSNLDGLLQRARTASLWPPDRAMAALMESLLKLELRGLIRRLPGPAFQRITFCAG